MTRDRILRKIAFGMLSLGIAACGSESTRADPQSKDVTEITVDLAREGGAAAWDAVEGFYNEAKEVGEEAMPDGIVQAAKDDIAKMGDWEYRIEEVSSDRTEMMKKLNGWGAERWEVYWVEPIDAGYTLHLKRSGRSYLRMIPVGSMLQGIPGAG